MPIADVLYKTLEEELMAGFASSTRQHYRQPGGHYQIRAYGRSKA
jgi:hypothetical protein